MGVPTLLLTVRGRRSGRLLRTALMFGEDGDRLVLVASNGGAERDPDWLLNLLATPEADVQVRADRFTVRARLATAAERPELWRRMVALFPMYDTYRAKAAREIPVVILERAPTPDVTPPPPAATT